METTNQTTYDFSKIKMFVMDVDGTLTDGKIYIGDDGECMKAFNPKDGLGIKLLIQCDIMPVIITGRTSNIVRNRCQELGINILFQGISNKVAKLKDLMKVYNLSADEVAYIGDDVNDLSAMKIAGISFAPADCAKQIIPHVNVLLTKKAGEAPVREAIDMILDSRIDDMNFDKIGIN